MKEIFKPVVAKEKLSYLFKLVDEFKPMDAAKEQIKSIAEEFEDKDGNFIEQFQTTGFDARLWELFLFKLFKENGFNIVNEHEMPDFQLKAGDLDVFVEASISNEKEGDKYSKDFIKQALKENNLGIQKELIDYYVIRMGSVLYSKLKKTYWNLDWVKGKPLVFATSPFHNHLAKFLPDAKLIEYLYGLRYETVMTDQGLFIKDLQNVEKHEHFAKEIPSNFFGQEHVENISAIIFTNNADLHKFNRMGHQSGLSKENIIMSRSGFSYDPTQNSPAKEFTYNINPGEYREHWSESVTIFHNPNALHKLDPSVFKNLRQVWLEEDGKLGGTETPETFVYNSITGAGIVP